MVKRPGSALILALVAAALFGGSVSSVRAQQSPQGWLDIDVLAVQSDGSMSPLAGITVLLSDASGAKVTSATADSNGELHLDVEAGMYSLTVYGIGYDGAGSMSCTDSSWNSDTDTRWGTFNAEQDLNVGVVANTGGCRRYLFTAEPPPPSAPAPAAPEQPSPSPGRQVHLTFDDGYVDLCQTVDLIIGLGVHATFFLTGQAIVTYPDCVRRLVAAGNQLGNHTWAHENLTRLSRQQILTSLQRTEDAAWSVAGVSTRPLCRPPYGAMNAAVRQVAAEWGCQMILWDRDTRDWAGVPASSIISTALSVSCNGETILMHTQAYPQERFAVPVVVNTLRSRGCEPVVF